MTKENRTKTGFLIPVEVNENFFVHDKEEIIIVFVKDISEKVESEKRVREIEEMHKQIIETSNDGILVLKPDSYPSFVNKKMAEMLGYSVTELLSIPVTNLLIQDDLENHKIKMSNRRENVSETYERRMIKKDGSIIWTLISATPRLDNQGDYIGSFALISDITERKKSEEFLKNLNRIYLTLSACNEALVHADNENTLLQTICEIIVQKGGYKLSTVAYTQNDAEKSFKIMSSAGNETDYLTSIKMSWGENAYGMGPAGRAVRSRKTQFVNSYTDSNFKMWKEIANKHGFYSSISLPLIIRDQVIGILGLYSDKEDSFIESELNLLENLANNLSYGIDGIRLKVQKEYTVDLLNEAQKMSHIGNWELKLTNNELTWSDEIYKIFEINSSSFTNKYESFLNLIHPDDKEEVDYAYTNSLKTHQPYSIDHRILFPDGRIKFVHEKCVTYYDDNLNPIRSVGTIQDITEIKQFQDEIRHLNQHLEKRVEERTNQLKQLNMELESFSFRVSHDLRVPIGHIDGYVKILQEHLNPNADGEADYFIKKIIESTHHANGVIDDILALSKMDYEELKLTPVNLNTIVKDIIQEFEVEISNRNILWNVANLPLVTCDKSLIRLVFVNLLSNALKFTKKQSKTIINIGHLSSKQEDTFFIKDNGVGFDMQFSDKLFNVFQRLHSTNEFQGNGIGLANVKKIIKRHGGDIWAESKVNEGATFYFSIPK